MIATEKYRKTGRQGMDFAKQVVGMIKQKILKIKKVKIIITKIKGPATSWPIDIKSIVSAKDPH